MCEGRELGTTSDKAQEDLELRNHEPITAGISNSSTTATTAPYAIMDLLNDEEEEEGEEDEEGEDRRHMAGTSNYLDGEEENPHSGSLRYGYCDDVTLPPLQLVWEDLATRPMFDIE